MKYKAKDNIYNQKKYYLKDKEYSEDEIPQGLSTEELHTLFIPQGIASARTPTIIDTGINDLPDEDNVDLNIATEHINLIEYAAANGVKSNSNWKPETIIKKLEGAGITGEELEFFKQIDWSLEDIEE